MNNNNVFYYIQCSMKDVVIKWSGSKRTLAPQLLKYFPKEIDTYYEPFVGGGSVLRALLNDTSIKVKRYICVDNDVNLISLWNAIKERPCDVADRYEHLWQDFNKTKDISYRKQYFESVRKRLNETHDPLDFMFIMRTCVNGLPRYNKNGEFNTSCHFTRNGIEPHKLRKIIFDWSQQLNEKNVEFRCDTYLNVHPTENDFCYLDPPYANTHGMYQGGFDNLQLFEWIESLPCKYVMNYDGIRGKVNNTYEVPQNLYSRHVYLYSGLSSYRRVMNGNKTDAVHESVYVK